MTKSNPISSFGNILVGVTLGRAAMDSVGNNLGGFSDATKSLIGVSILSNTYKNTKGMFSFK